MKVTTREVATPERSGDAARTMEVQVTILEEAGRTPASFSLQQEMLHPSPCPLSCPCGAKENKVRLHRPFGLQSVQ